MTSQPRLDNEIEPLLFSPTLHNKKVWYKTASAYFLLPALMLFSISMGLDIPPRVQFYLKAVCYDYYSEKGRSLPAFSVNPINDPYPDEWCNNAEVQAVTSRFIMITNLCSSIPAIFVLGPLGSLSDRKGRKISLLIPTVGIILNTIIMLLVGNFLETLGLYFLLIGLFINGITGGSTALFATSMAYVSDCTSTSKRSVMFGWVQGAVYMGIALGPIIGGWIVEVTNDLLLVFYILLLLYIIFLSYLFFILPESLTKENLLNNLKKQQELNSTFNNTSKSLKSLLIYKIYSIFKPLTIFFQNDHSDITSKYSLLFLAIMNTLLMAGVSGMKSVLLLYVTLVFKWSLLDQGYFLFMMGISRAIVLFFLFPTLITSFENKFLKNINHNINNSNNNDEQIEEDINNENQKLRKEFSFEVWALKLSLLIDAFAYTSLGLTTSSLVFVGAILTASLGSISFPIVKSLLTKLIMPSQTGELFGALSVLDSIVQIISPIIFNTLYSILILTSPRLIWYVFGIVFVIACLFSIGVIPKKHP